MFPEKVWVPLPVLLIDPPTPEIAPEKVVELELSLPRVRLAVPRVTFPAPASEPMVLLKWFRAKVFPLAMVNAEFGESAVVEPAWMIPLLTVVAPL